MIKLIGAWEFICPTIDDLTPDQLEAMKIIAPARGSAKTGLYIRFNSSRITLTNGPSTQKVTHETK